MPPLQALRERNNQDSIKDKKYILGNWGFNLVGAASAIFMFILLKNEIKNEEFWHNYCVSEILSLCIPFSIGIAMAYQHIEQQLEKQGELRDHSASLQWRNQRLNLLHLTMVFLFSIFSTIIIMCYTLYFHNNKLLLNFSGLYLVYLCVVLIFFYVCGVHKLEHVYRTFQIYVPIILVASMFWISWFDNIREWESYILAYIVVTLFVYVILVYKRKKIIIIDYGNIDEPGDSQDTCVESQDEQNVGQERNEADNTEIVYTGENSNNVVEVENVSNTNNSVNSDGEQNADAGQETEEETEEDKHYKTIIPAIKTPAIKIEALFYLVPLILIIICGALFFVVPFNI